MRGETDEGDIVPTRYSTSRVVKGGIGWSVLGCGHPQRLSLKGHDQLVGEGRSRLTHSGGGVRNLNGIEERWEVSLSYMLPKGRHISRILDQE